MEELGLTQWTLIVQQLFTVPRYAEPPKSQPSNRRRVVDKYLPYHKQNALALIRLMCTCHKMYRELPYALPVWCLQDAFDAPGVAWITNKKVLKDWKAWCEDRFIAYARLGVLWRANCHYLRLKQHTQAFHTKFSRYARLCFNLHQDMITWVRGVGAAGDVAAHNPQALDAARYQPARLTPAVVYLMQFRYASEGDWDSVLELLRELGNPRLEQAHIRTIIPTDVIALSGACHVFLTSEKPVEQVQLRGVDHFTWTILHRQPSITGSLGSVKSVTIRELERRMVPLEIGALANVPTVSVKCGQLEDFAPLQAAKELSLAWTCLVPLTQFANVQRLTLNHVSVSMLHARAFTFNGTHLVMKQLQGFHGPVNLPRASTIVIDDCDALTQVVCSSKRIHLLRVSQCRELSTLSLVGVEHVSDVCITDSALKDFTFLGTALGSLTLQRCPSLTSLQLPRLKYINNIALAFCNTLLMAVIRASTAMQTLAVGVCNDLRGLHIDVPGADAILVDECMGIEQLSFQGKTLKKLRVDSSPELVALLLDAVQDLRELVLWDCSALTSIACRSPNITSLSLARCPVLASVSMPMFEGNECADFTDLDAAARLAQSKRRFKKLFIIACPMLPPRLPLFEKAENFGSSLPLPAPMLRELIQRVTLLNLNAAASKHIGTVLHDIPAGADIQLYDVDASDIRGFSLPASIKSVVVLVSDEFDVAPLKNVAQVVVKGQTNDAALVGLDNLKAVGTLHISKCALKQGELHSACAKQSITLEDCTGAVVARGAQQVLIRGPRMPRTSLGDIAGDLSLWTVSGPLKLEFTRNVRKCSITSCTLEDFHALAGVRVLELTKCTFDSVGTLPYFESLSTSQCVRSDQTEWSNVVLHQFRPRDAQSRLVPDVHLQHFGGGFRW
ncbi:hypothetical protein PTSG_00934 [Salpingoeca rosetta]|uniref:Uncharacterized protein n=1 Tax=Salpingoeca rosetta (strain ATCC 50818 / BSB-021) TaxID=946362 RepID=F2TXX3_SALR5|nr:uncharacterized protein PTSG_00934 [Salpingoeca rosetta]EGD76232.1 hypothetical protein PTSG_00934 [Salpingoeca rosetta]|eukprot:XP_004998407.1 hypothetical protein PTSG_00934 [Salpingoeca rosetta]